MQSMVCAKSRLNAKQRGARNASLKKELQNFFMQEVCARTDIHVDMNRYLQSGSGYQHIGDVWN
jgi:hypothetical protein